MNRRQRESLAAKEAYRQGLLRCTPEKYPRGSVFDRLASPSPVPALYYYEYRRRPSHHLAPSEASRQLKALYPLVTDGQ